MGMGEPAVYVDRQVELSCPRGHALRSFHTRDLDGLAVTTYLVHGDRLYRAEPGNSQPGNSQPGNSQPGNSQPGNSQPGNSQPGNGHAEAAATPEVWRIEADAVVREHRFGLREVKGPRTVRIHATCPVCYPVHNHRCRGIGRSPAGSRTAGEPGSSANVVNAHGTLLDARRPRVRFRLTFRSGEPLHIERMPALAVVASRPLL
jgi:hypothetical protein